jgi:4-amino-4-deoxy-L-arabinose transferase-like glycosyltransferase
MSFPRLLFKAGMPVVSIFLLLAGVMLLRAELWSAGAICGLAAMLGLICSVRSLEKSSFSADETGWLRSLALPVSAWLVIIVLSTVAVINVSDNNLSAQSDRLASWAWLASLVGGFLLVWGRRLGQIRAEAVLKRIKAHRLELSLLLVILVLALDLRTIGLAQHPYPWSGDEASVGIEAARILRGEVTNLFDMGWAIQPNWSFVPTAITEILFGRSILAVRLASALAGTLAVLFVYLAGRELFNPPIGLMGAGFLATLAYHLHFSRVGVDNIMDSTLSGLVLWLLARALKKDSISHFYAAGAAAGLCIYSYAGTRLVIIIAGIILLYTILKNKGYLVSHWKHLAAFAGAALVSAAPQAAYFLRHWNAFLGRFGQEGIFMNGWAQQQMALTGKNVLHILADQFMGTTLVFIAKPALTNFFNSPQPYLTVIGSVLFLLGMAYAFAYVLEPAHFILLAWFWSVILFGGVLTLNPPAHTRLLMTTPAVALFMGLGTYKIMEYLRKLRLASEHLFAPVFALAVLIIAIQNISFYMFEYPARMYFQDANGEAAMEIGSMAAELGPDFTIYVLGEPRVYSGFPTITFIAPDNRYFDLRAEDTAGFSLAAGQSAAFFAIPEDIPSLEEIKMQYPGGQGGRIYRKPFPEEVLLEYYVLKR